MTDSPIYFFYEHTDFRLDNPDKISNWLQNISQSYDFEIQQLNYIFCNDEYLHQINLEYLDHDTYTDIITFDNSEQIQKIEGDIFISIERVQDNSQAFKVSFEQELQRVAVHGLLHLLGFKDKTKDEQTLMRLKENEAIATFNIDN